MPVKIFLCYARKDASLLNKLKDYLWPLEKQGLIDLWYDREISAGTEWEKEIDKHLNEAQIILLLVSPDFMNSNYINNIELKRAIERHDRGEARVIPVILRLVHWQSAPFGRLQALPKNGKPVKSWRDMDKALFEVAEGIRFDLIQEPASMLDIALDSKEASTELPVSSPDIPAEITRKGWFLAPSDLLEGSNSQDYDEKYLTLADELAEFKHKFRSSDLDNYFDVLVSGEDLLLEVIGKDRYNDLHANVALIMLHIAQAGLAKNNGDLTAETSNRDIANAVLMTLKKRVDGIRLRQSRRK